MFRTTLAMMMINAPMDAIEVMPPGIDWYYTGLALRKVCVREQLIEPDSAKYYFNDPKTFIGDLHIVKTRYNKIKDCPPFSDEAMFLITSSDIENAIKLNVNYRTYLEKLKYVCPANADKIDLVIDENKELLKALTALRTIKNEYNFYYIRREALKEYRNFIGNELYYRGYVIPAITTQYLEER